MGQTQESVLQSKLESSVLYKQLKTKCAKLECGPHVLALVHEVGQYALQKSKTVIKNMPEFTLHDEDHIFDMFFIIGKLIPQKTLSFMSVPDLMLTLISVFLHDIGMCPEENQILAWKNQLLPCEQEKYAEEAELFIRFRKTYTQQVEEIDAFIKSGAPSKAQLLEDYIITEYIRITHADRARKVIARDWKGKIVYRDTDLTSDLAEICFSHNEEYTALLNLETIKVCDTDVYCCIPFVAVLLRLADIIDFDTKRTPKVLFSHLTVRNPVSLSEWRKHQAVKSWTISGKNLVFAAECIHPAIEASIREFCDLIDEELRSCTLILSQLYSDYLGEDIFIYKISLPATVDRRKIHAVKDIETGKPIYRYHDTKFTLSKKQVIDLLMGTKLYGKADVALRELIQNSIDACVLRQKLNEKWGDSYTPKIEVSYFSEDGKDCLCVNDNGIGMNQHIIDNYYTRIGSSYYTSREFFELMADAKSSFKPISRFGIGILACFMVCDNLEVNTRRVIGRFQYDEPIKINIEGYESLFTISDSDKSEPGTETTLYLNKLHPWNKMTNSSFVESVKSILPLPPFEITIRTQNEQLSYKPDDFEELGLSPLQDYTWTQVSSNEKDNIKVIDIDLNSSEEGFRGSASIAYIVKNGVPVGKVELISKTVLVEDDPYTLSFDISYGNDCIYKNSTQIEIDEEGNIEARTSQQKIAASKSALSIHGIDVPCNLFSDYANYGQKAILIFPFPITFRLDIGSIYELNLNSARTQIIYDDVWLNFEKQFMKVVCTKLKERMENSMWIKFRKIMSAGITDATLKSIIDNI